MINLKILVSMGLLTLFAAACQPAVEAPQPAPAATATTAPTTAPTATTAVPATDTPAPAVTPTPAPTATPAVADPPESDNGMTAFAETLRLAIDHRDSAALQAAMGDRFDIINWMGDGKEYSPAEAAAVLQSDYLVTGGSAQVQPGADLATLLADRPLAFFAPDFKAERAWLVTGLGSEGRGEGLAFIARQPDGKPYWNGMLFAPSGFDAAGMATYLKWETYSNAEHGFTLQYPDGWQVAEVPNATYQSGVDQVWLAAGELPPPHTGAGPDVAVTITADDPSPQWDKQYFDDYEAKSFMLGEFPATRITGTNKESQTPMEAVIARVGDVYLQVTPNQNPDTRWQYEVILTTLAALAG